MRLILILIGIGFCQVQAFEINACPDELIFNIIQMDDLSYHGSRERLLSAQGKKLVSVEPCKYQDSLEVPMVYAYINQTEHKYDMTIPFSKWAVPPTDWTKKFYVAVYSSAISLDDRSFFQSIRTVFNDGDKLIGTPWLESWDSAFYCSGHGGGCGTAWMRYISRGPMRGWYQFVYGDEKIQLDFDNDK